MRALVVFAALALTACKTAPLPTASVPLPQPSQEQVLSQTLDSVVALVTDEGFVYCSGSFLAGDNVLTAAHCLEGVATGGEVLVMTRSMARYKYTVVKKDEVHDLGMLSPQEFLTAHPALALALEAPSYGDRVVLIGHPHGITWSVFPGRVNNPSQYGYGNTDGLDHWMMVDCGGGPGTSGGPVVDIWGDVVGVNIWSPTKYSGWRGVVHLQEIQNFIGSR